MRTLMGAYVFLAAFLNNRCIEDFLLAIENLIVSCNFYLLVKSKQ